MASYPESTVKLFRLYAIVYRPMKMKHGAMSRQVLPNSEASGFTLPDSTAARFDKNDGDTVVERFAGVACSSTTDEIVSPGFGLRSSKQNKIKKPVCRRLSKMCM